MYTSTIWACDLWDYWAFQMSEVHPAALRCLFTWYYFGQFGNQPRQSFTLYTQQIGCTSTSNAHKLFRCLLWFITTHFTILYSRYKPYLYWQSLTFLRLRGWLSHKRGMKCWSPQDLVQKVLTQASVCPKWIKTNCKISWWPTIRWKVELVVLNLGRGLIHRK